MTKFGEVLQYDGRSGVAVMRYIRPDACAKCGACGHMDQQGSIRLKADCAVKEGDILSLKGKGKGSISGMGGTSRKGRLFVYGEIYK